MTVREEEGLTLVVRQSEADALGLPYEHVAARISLRLRSALGAVGSTAIESAALAGRGISCNVAAGAFHDHLFVPPERAEEAVAVLQHLRRSPGADDVE